MSVVGVWLEPRHAQAHARACSAHDLMLVTVSNDYVSGWQAAGNISPKARAADYWAAWFGSRSNWLQLVSCCGGLFVARTRARSRPLSAVLYSMLWLMSLFASFPSPWGSGTTQTSTSTTGVRHTPVEVDIRRGDFATHKPPHRETSCSRSRPDPNQAAMPPIAPASTDHVDACAILAVSASTGHEAGESMQNIIRAVVHAALVGGMCDSDITHAHPTQRDDRRARLP